jgi:UDPglucose 6-dehydrogenase
MNIAVIGTGYVGLVTTAFFAELGHTVIGVDLNEARIEALRRGEIPIHEPGLDQLIHRHRELGRVAFTTSLQRALLTVEVAVIAVGTPPGEDGSTDLSAVDAVAREIGACLTRPLLIVVKSTVPVGTGDRVEAILREQAPHIQCEVVSNPEFLREGTAIRDALQPDRVVLGSNTDRARVWASALYRNLDAPVFHTDRRSSELVKYAANAFLATRISFANGLALMCESVDASVDDVMAGAGMDHRIGPHFFSAGIGFGGSCFPKDCSSLVHQARAAGTPLPLVESVLEVNAAMIDHAFEKLERQLGGVEGRRVAVLGLAFKPDTDDVRESRGIALCRRLASSGASVRAHDPVACANGAGALVDCRVEVTPDLWWAISGCDAVVLATEWSEYLHLEPGRLAASMRGRVIVDGRNALDAQALASAGLDVCRIGKADLSAHVSARQVA